MYRKPIEVKDVFRSHSRRALILTTVKCESQSVKAHLTDIEVIIGEKGAFYEMGKFSDPSGDWLIVHALTSQGNSDAGLVASNAFHEFGNFDVLMFVGVAGSLKPDIPIGSVVIGDYVYNGHSAKVEDETTFVRPHGLAAAKELLTAAQALIYHEEWVNLICAPFGMELPCKERYPCDFPPEAFIKGIVSGEEVVAGDKSSRFSLLRTHFNDCGAVEMEGWGVMNSAHHENASAIIVRGISDMCAGKDHENDKFHQPIAAAHAAAFAFSILSFRSKVPVEEGQVLDVETKKPILGQGVDAQAIEDSRIEFVFNIEGLLEEWSDQKTKTITDLLKEALGDENIKLTRIQKGSIRLIYKIRSSDLKNTNFIQLREVFSGAGFKLLGAIALELSHEADDAKVALANASSDLLSWKKTLPNGRWMDRPEQDSIEARFKLNNSSTVLLGEPGTGKSALLSKIACDLISQKRSVFALKADFLSTNIRTESDLQRELHLQSLPSDLILQIAALQPIYVLIDQLDALAIQLDLQSGRLNVLLNLVRRIGGVTNVHVLVSARSFEFNHDVRLSAINAEPVMLSLPPWHEVKERLIEVNVDPDTWPEMARDVIRIPQALKTFIDLVNLGKNEPFSNYQAMLEQLWQARIASAEDSESLIDLASDIAGKMANEEALWLAASRFDSHVKSLNRLEALGFIVRSENNLSIAFNHQTLFDYVLARSFVRNVGLLSKYVFERQDSLFVRSKLWSALNYLREAEVTSYEREIIEIWKKEGLRRHIRLLLIEFLGQVHKLFEFEKTLMTEVLKSPDIRVYGLKAIGQNSEWFDYFALSEIRKAMSGTYPEINQACQILTHNWNKDENLVFQLMTECWMPHPEKDSYSWRTLHGCQVWSDKTEKIAVTVLSRTPISIWDLMHISMTLALEQPKVALRIVRAKLNFLLTQAKNKPVMPEMPNDYTEQEEIYWHMTNSPTKYYENILDDTSWDDLPSLSEAAPNLFIEYLWPWYLSIFEEILNHKDIIEIKSLFPGRYFLELEKPSDAQLGAREKPLMSAIQIAVCELARKDPDEFLEWANENSNIKILVVQQLIADGYAAAASKLSSKALEWILNDHRRFQLGNSHGHRLTTIDLLQAISQHLSDEEIQNIQEAISNYNPQAPDHFKDPIMRREFLAEVRVTKKDSLQALGLERLSPTNRELIITEQRALGSRYDKSISLGEGGIIGSPMNSSAMAKAKNDDILKIFNEIPDNTNWDHPTHWMKGGNIQLSRAFAEFANEDPERALHLIEKFKPMQQERAAGYALDSMANDVLNEKHIINAFLNLHHRGFKTEAFRSSAASAIQKIASRKAVLSDQIIEVLIDWLNQTSDSEDKDENIELSINEEDNNTKNESIIWGYGHTTIIPSGNFDILSAIITILLNEKDSSRNRLFSILNNHLLHEKDPNVWKALLIRLNNFGGEDSKVASKFICKLFGMHPKLLLTREAIVFLAYTQNWDDQLVFDLIKSWPEESTFLQKAYGELVGLVSTTKPSENWLKASDEIITSGTASMKVGLAHAAVNMWPDEKLRLSVLKVLTRLLKSASKELVAVVMDVFRVSNEVVPDTETISLLQALTEPNLDLSLTPSHFVLESLQALLPNEAELIANLTRQLVNAWYADLGDIQANKSSAAPQIIDIALTLHRIGGESRKSGVALFEKMVEIDAYSARETLAEIDGRFDQQRQVTRKRISRRTKLRRQRRFSS